MAQIISRAVNALYSYTVHKLRSIRCRFTGEAKRAAQIIAANERARQDGVRSRLRSTPMNTLQRMIRAEPDILERRLILQTIPELVLEDARKAVDRLVSACRVMSVNELGSWYPHVTERNIRLLCLSILHQRQTEKTKAKKHGVGKEVVRAIEAAVATVAHNMERERRQADIAKRLTLRSTDRLYEIRERASDATMRALVERAICVNEGVFLQRDGAGCSLPEAWRQWLVRIEPRVGLLGLSKAQRQHQRELLQMLDEEEEDDG